MKHLLIYILTLISFLSFGQNKHLNIGIKENGICFGNSKRTNGIRFNLIDSNLTQVNGLNIAMASKSKQTNGFTFGLYTNDSICNGILIDGLMGKAGKMNGVLFSSFGHFTHKFNGVGLGVFPIAGDTLNGLFMSPIGITWWNSQKIKLINGLTVGIITGVNTEKLNGVSIGLINNVIDKQNGLAISLINRSKELHGFQIGLWNVAENNRIFKRAPIINFNFRRKASR